MSGEPIDSHNVPNRRTKRVVLIGAAVLAILVAIGVHCARSFLLGAKASVTIGVLHGIRSAADAYCNDNDFEFPRVPNNHLLATLHGLKLIQVVDGDDTTMPGFRFVRAEHEGGGRRYGVVVECIEDSASCEDIWWAMSRDLESGSVGSIRCHGPPPAAPPEGGTVHLCFSARRRTK